MTFDDLLAQVLALLQREQRLSYRALQRRFALEEADLEAVKDELIYAKRLAVDEAGRVLVWVGDTGTTSAPASQVPQSAPTQADHQTEQPTPHGLPAVAPPPPEAERRQLTILFCDLVGSVALSRQLDPEDYRAAVRAYQAACAVVIERFDGHIAQYLGDGLLVYFGYPLAHEDDAQRAVRAGLGIVEAIHGLPLQNTLLQHSIQVRIGIHTGLVVAGEMGVGDQPEPLAIVGETPNLAARLQQEAQPNTVVISAATYHLIQGYFECADLGLCEVKGMPAPLQMYRVLGESEVQGQLEVA